MLESDIEICYWDVDFQEWVTVMKLDDLPKKCKICANPKRKLDESDVDIEAGVPSW